MLYNNILRSRFESLESPGGRTFDKHLGEALFLSDHTLVGGVIRQRCPVDGQRPDVSVSLHDVPGEQEDKIRCHL